MKATRGPSVRVRWQTAPREGGEQDQCGSLLRPSGGESTLQTAQCGCWWMWVMQLVQATKYKMQVNRGASHHYSQVLASQHSGSGGSRNLFIPPTPAHRHTCVVCNVEVGAFADKQPHGVAAPALWVKSAMCSGGPVASSYPYSRQVRQGTEDLIRDISQQLIIDPMCYFHHPLCRIVTAWSMHVLLLRRRLRCHQQSPQH
jgi:hypothetical protein